MNRRLQVELTVQSEQHILIHGFSRGVAHYNVVDC